MTRPLHDWIVQKIKADGPVTFAQYMAWALYQPEWGYYSSGRVRIGTLDKNDNENENGNGGDFTTAPHFSRLFGRCLARLVEAADRALGEPIPFTLVEGGPGEGTLARDLLDAVAERSPDLYARLHYVADETSPALKKRQRQTLADHQRCLRDHAPDGYTGLYLSNELVDALPVHRLQVSSERVEEGFVAVADGELVERWGDASQPEFAEEAKKLYDGDQPCVVELCPNAREWLTGTASNLGRGYLATIDYGDTADRLFGPQRPEGSCRGFRQHQHAETLLDAPGETDLTASVNFSQLLDIGTELGLENSPLIPQRDFLFALGIAEELTEAEAGLNAADAHQLRQQLWPLLMSGTGMGESFKALVQGKNAELEPLPLDAMKGLGSLTF